MKKNLQKLQEKIKFTHDEILNVTIILYKKLCKKF